MKYFDDNGFQGVIGVSQIDITPPVGIYARSWGAAVHDKAEGVHRPLLLTCVTLQKTEEEDPLILIGADFCVWRNAQDGEVVRSAILKEYEICASRLMYCLGHTHAGPVLSRDDSEKPGGQYINVYLEELRIASVRVVKEALKNSIPAVLEWKYGKCGLATNRDFYDETTDRLLTGFNPDRTADDTLLVGRITGMDQKVIGTIVNYACHPTTLGWDNRLLSPDYIGSMRELVAEYTQAPCLFLQGASGDLAPREQYVADTNIADKNGRELGFAVLSVLESMLPQKTSLTFEGSVKSGADLAIWSRKTEMKISDRINAEMTEVLYELKSLPSFHELDEQYNSCEDPVERERLWRKRSVRKTLGDGDTVRVPLWIWWVGDTALIGQPNEAYSELQLRLRRSWPNNPVVVINLVNGSAGYLPPSELYASECYTVWQTPFAEGSLEKLQSVAYNALKQVQVFSPKL